MAELKLIDKNILSKFIDKLAAGQVKGKGLSSNDFTDEYKEKVDTVTYSNIEEKLSSAGWYRIYESDMKNNVWDNIELTIAVKASPLPLFNENYTLLINLNNNVTGKNNIQCSITLINGCVIHGYLQIEKIRILYKINDSYYIDIYFNCAHYPLNVNINGQGRGNFVTFISQADEIPSQYEAAEFELVSGFKTNALSNLVSKTDIGYTNGKIPKLVEFPSRQELLTLGYNINGEDDLEGYLKSICKWFYTNFNPTTYENTYIGATNHNYRGNIIMGAYGNNENIEDNPNNIYGIFFGWDVKEFIRFGYQSYNWYFYKADLSQINNAINQIPLKANISDVYTRDEINEKDLVSKTYVNDRFEQLHKQWVGTQSEYDAITNKNANTIYYIKEG